MADQEDVPAEAEGEETIDVSKAFVDMAQANTDLGVKCVELLCKIDDKDEELSAHKEVICGIRVAAGLEDGDGVSLVARVKELRERGASLAIAELDRVILELDAARADIMTTARNLCWMAERIHQGYHGEVHGEPPTWRECPKGVCGSMEHMLAQVGFDKDLKPTDRRP